MEEIFSRNSRRKGNADDTLSDGIEEDFWMRMYYGGSVTSETHKKFKENGSIKYGNVRKIMKIYDYIFDMRDASTIEDNEANEIRQCLVDLYIMRPKENFSYEDKLKELMFYTYLHTKDNCLREAALEYFSRLKYQNVDLNNCEDILLIKRPNGKGYNTKYGIQCESCVEKLDENKSTGDSLNCIDEKNDDWISKYLSGVEKEIND